MIYKLAERLGMTVHELEGRMTVDEYQTWRALFLVEQAERGIPRVEVD